MVIGLALGGQPAGGSVRARADPPVGRTRLTVESKLGPALVWPLVAAVCAVLTLGPLGVPVRSSEPGDKNDVGPDRSVIQNLKNWKA